MKLFRLTVALTLIVIPLFLACTTDQSKTNEGIYQGKPAANIELLVAEVDNGGFDQYFFNSSGVDCFETLRALERNGKTKTANILRQAITLINPDNLPEDQLVDRIRRRKVDELEDQKVSEGLSKMDSLFYAEPDGPLLP